MAGKFDPHAVEAVGNRLIKHYTRSNQLDDAKRLHKSIAEAFERFAAMGNAMLASAVLQTAVNAYAKAGLPEEAKRLRILMQEKINERSTDPDGSYFSQSTSTKRGFGIISKYSNC